MLDSDLAELYGVKTEVLNQAVKRNRERFPQDFMFQLTPVETRLLRFQSGTLKIGKGLRSQIVISNGRGGRRYVPYVFTEQGVEMLSGILHSKRAIQANIAIMRAFVKLRRMLATHRKLAQKLMELEHRLEGHNQQIRSIFDAIRQRITWLTQQDQAAVTSPIVFELLQGTRSGHEFTRLHQNLSSLHPFPVTESDWLKAAQWAQRLRVRGLAAKTVDFLIAYKAMRHRLVLLHADRDFDRIAGMVSLKVESYVKLVRFQ